MDNRLLIAVVIGWIMSVCLHEYAHALTAYWAGDRTVRDRGYLSMNPLSYVDPVYSLVLPAIILLIGGIPLPGGAVLIDRSAFRMKWQASLVSAAGPVMNIVLFLVLAGVIHPKLGLIESGLVETWPVWAVFAGAMAFLQVFAVLLNLIPIPPLDGFNVVEPYLKPSTRERIMHSPLSSMGFFIIFAAFMFIPQVSRLFYQVIFAVFAFVGVPPHVPYSCYRLALFGQASG